MIETLSFIFIVPFKENVVFPTLIVGIFIIAVFSSWYIHKQRLNYYTNQIENIIHDDWSEEKPLYFIPGILMSIGIVGTFYLIYSSLSHIEIDKIDKLSEIIRISIAPAFSISALGIVTSITYILIEQFFIQVFKNKIEKIQLKYSPKTYESIALGQFNISHDLLYAIQKQTETFEGMNNFSSSLQEASVGMRKFGDIASVLEDTLNPNVLGKVIANAVNNEMKPILEKVQNVTNNVDRNSQKITYFLEEDLKNEIILPLKKSVDTTSESMLSIEQALQKTSDAMIKTNKGFDKLNESLDSLESSQNNFVIKLDNVLEKQKNEFEATTQVISETYNALTENVKEQMEKFNENSQKITHSFTGLSTEMKEFLIGYKEDYKNLLNNQEKAIKETSQEAVTILTKAGEVASQTISGAAEKLQSTLDGVDEALIKTSQSIKAELENFKDSYTDSLKVFLDSQEEILNNVFKEQTQRLAGVVENFKENLESDVKSRKLLNEELDTLIKTTNGFVSSTQAMITAAYDEQNTQLKAFMQTNQSMRFQLENLINNTTDIQENGNTLTKELIETTANLQKQFNDNQIKILEEYQLEVDKHLKDILGYMATIIEASHINKD